MKKSVKHVRLRPTQVFKPEFMIAEARAYYGAGEVPKLLLRDDSHGVFLYHGDSLIFLERVQRKYPDGVFDVIFADPPYFLSDGGITCQAGRMVSVDKGEWDKIESINKMHEFNTRWLFACQKALKANGSIFVSGTSHVIHSVGFAMQQLDFKLLNDITWVKPNPPPNLSCRYFTHAYETILWAAKNKKSKHKFNYALMKEMSDNRQMKSVWYDIDWNGSDVQMLMEIPPPSKREKMFGKHPTQKPLMLLERLLLAASDEGDLVFDPFTGSGTTAVASRKLGRRFVGCEVDLTYVEIAKKRLESFQETRHEPLLPLETIG